MTMHIAQNVCESNWPAHLTHAIRVLPDQIEQLHNNWGEIHQI